MGWGGGVRGVLVSSFFGSHESLLGLTLRKVYFLISSVAVFVLAALFLSFLPACYSAPRLAS